MSIITQCQLCHHLYVNYVTVVFIRLNVNYVFIFMWNKLLIGSQRVSPLIGAFGKQVIPE